MERACETREMGPLSCILSVAIYLCVKIFACWISILAWLSRRVITASSFCVVADLDFDPFRNNGLACDRFYQINQKSL